MCWFCITLNFFGVWILSNDYSIATISTLLMFFAFICSCNPLLAYYKAEWFEVLSGWLSEADAGIRWSLDYNASKNIHIAVAFTFFGLAQHLGDLSASVILFVKCEQVPRTCMRLGDTMMAVVELPLIHLSLWVWPSLQNMVNTSVIRELAFCIQWWPRVII